MKFAIYIPARNTAQTLRSVYHRIPEPIRAAAEEIIIVDNASTDSTPEVALELASSYSNVHYLRHDMNRGYGGSQKSAYRRCVEKGYDAVIMIHGDGQYAPELAGTLLERLMKGKAGMVFGSRISGNPLAGGMPLYRFFANIFLSRFANMLLGSGLSEFHSGYRAFRVGALSQLRLQDFSDDYHFDTDIIVGLIEQNDLIEEVTIPTHYGKESKSIGFFHSIWYGLNVLKAVSVYRLRKIRLLR